MVWELARSRSCSWQTVYMWAPISTVSQHGSIQARPAGLRTKDPVMFSSRFRLSRYNQQPRQVFGFLTLDFHCLTLPPPQNTAGPRGLPLLGGMPWIPPQLCCRDTVICQQLCFALSAPSTAFIAPASLLSSPGPVPTCRQRRTHVKRHLLLSTAELAAGPACFQARNRGGAGADTAMASVGDPAISCRL